MAGKIFISYRRSENDWQARALFERLWRHFPHRVFIDLEGLKPGAEFADVIDEHLEECFVMLAVIGPKWIEEIHDRLTHDEVDYVQIELARALGRGIPVVPVLVDGASIPKERELPSDLRRLAKRHALDLATKFFDGQMAILEREIRSILAAAGEHVDPDLVPVQWVTDKKAFEAKGKAEATGLGHAGAGPAIVISRAKWMSDEGTDQLGRWAEFKVDDIKLRMRWIAPGKFWMGSSEGERIRFSEGAGEDHIRWIENEGPRHSVRIRQGFWMAETACTQQLWLVVCGDSPSKFIGGVDLPVEQVSWDDVTGVFMPKLNELVPGLNAALPSEAQWEFACRAGSESAYSFGAWLTSEQANYDGNFPPPGGVTGNYRARTVPVMSMPPNQLGLHQMHGNVWEWCADWFGPYTAREVIDPLGPSIGREKVLRGGGWSNGARRCRSASRNADRPDARVADVGFRIVLNTVA